MSIKERNCFLLYHTFANQFELLNMEERGLLITAVFQYAKNQSISIELPMLVQMAFSCMKDTLDRDMESYTAKCKQNAENGKKGGRPKKDLFLPKTEGFFEIPEKADKDRDKDMDLDFELKNDLDRDRDKDIDSGSASCESASAQAPNAPLLTQEEESLLLEKQIPAAYIQARQARASLYAAKTAQSLSDVLLLWWNTDRTQKPWNQSASPPHSSTLGNSFDADDFLAAALQHPFQMRRPE